MRCSHCEHDNPPQAKFCLQCGSRLTLACSQCRTELPGGARFCLNCGQPVDGPPAAAGRFHSPGAYTPAHLAERILTSKSALEGERKQVTVLFADLKGSMALLADSDPEQARKLLDPVLQHMMEAVHRYEGTVNQVMGDGIMALFGAPLSLEDHAVRACYAALRMQETVKRYAEDVRRTQGIPVQIRVGLNSGEVVVRSIGSDLHMDYTAVGQTTHLAARMEQLADPGCILLPLDTLQLVNGLVEVRALGKVPVKGLVEPVDVYELRGAGWARRRFEAAASRGLTRFVGRDTELDVLEKLQQQAATGHGQMLAVVGEAAVGKSRLFFEFTHSQRANGWLVLQGSSLAYGKATPFLPVIDLLKNYFQIEARDDPRTIREKMSGKLVRLDESLTSALPVFLELMDIPASDPQWQTLDSSQRRRRTFDACKQLLLRESLVQPLVLIFEDLHWIDSKTQAFLDGFVDSLPSARIFLLVNYRPEYEHGWASRTYYTQLRVDPLPSENAGELLTSLLGADAELQDLKKLLIETTQGNPFFLEESVRTLVETGALSGGPGSRRLATPLPEIRVPATVQAVLAARIDRLPSDYKHLLQTASVIGETVPFALLQAISDMSEEELRQGLSRLQAVEFLYETSLFPELEYTFKHALTHQVAYNSLLGDRRRALHARILDVMEKIYGDRLGQDIDRFAQHAFRGEVWPKALAYLRQSGLKAETRSAYREAVSCFENALTALEHLPQDRETLELALDVRFDLRTSLFPLGKLERVLEYLEQADHLSEKLDDRLRQAWASVYKCHYYWVTGQSARAYELGKRAHSMQEPLKHFPLRVTANYYLGLACLSVGDYSGAEKLLGENVDSIPDGQIRERFGVAGFPAAMSRTYLAWALAQRGEFDQGIVNGRKGVRLAEEIGHAWSLVTASWGYATVYITEGEPEPALDLLDRALALSRDWYLAALTPGVMGSLGYAKAMLGQTAEGLSMLQEATRVAEASGRLAFHSLLLVYLGEALVAARRIDDARPVAELALALSRERGERGVEASALRLLAEVISSAESSRAAEAQGLYQDAIALAERNGMRPLLARCRLGMGNLCRLRGDQEQAAEQLAIAAESFRDLKMHSRCKQAEAQLGDVR